MAIQAKAAAAAKDIGKRLLAKVAGVGGEEDGEARGASPAAAAAAAVGVFLLVGVWAIASAPMQLFDMAAGYVSGALASAGPSTAWAGGLADNVENGSVGWYCGKADELSAYARSTWNSGTGEDVYNTPDWRVLMAFDMAVAEDDFDLVRANEGYYDELHERLLKATSVTKERRRAAERVSKPAEVTAHVEEPDSGEWERYASQLVLYVLGRGPKPDEPAARTVEVPEEGAYWSDAMDCWAVDGYEEGAVYDADNGEWVVVEYYRTWSVSTRDVKALFKGSGAGGTLSDAFKYFAVHESADYGADTWGDGGNALGYYQFDRRYALDDLLQYAVDNYGDMFSYFGPWVGVGTIARGDPELLSAWQRAWREHPAEWAAVQDGYEYDNFFMPSADYLESMGIDVHDRHDAVKGLVCSITNLFGPGGAIGYIDSAGLSPSMSDAEFATALCNSVISNCASRVSNYASAYQNRYANELEEVLSLIQTSAPGSTPTAAACLGKDPEAEGKDLDLADKGGLYESYRRATYAVTVTDGPFGSRSVKFDYERFEQIVTSGEDPSAGAGSTVVERAQSYLGRADYVWGACSPGAFDCSGFVSYCLTGEYQRIGTTYTFLTWERTSDPQPGDVCVNEAHCGIYIGGGDMIHCTSYGDNVIIGPVQAGMVYVKYPGGA